VALSIEKDVVTLDITMNDALGVQMLEALAGLRVERGHVSGNGPLF
jgi:hypothetical protein